MSGVKPWQIGVIVVGLLVGTASAVYSFTRAGNVTLPHRSVWVDVETGDLFDVDTSRSPLLAPAMHPVTRRYSLLRTTKSDSGAVRIADRHMSILDELDKAVKPEAVNLETGEVKLSGKASTEYRSPE
jgi:hypothetical protein